jgi:hypothetical protein
MSMELIVAIIGIGIALVSILVSIVIARRYRDRRELSYETQPTPQLLSVDEAIREDISIKYEGRDVQNLAGITVTIRSTGNRAIRFPTDDTQYEEPVTIYFGEGTEVIGTPRITKTVPDGLDASLEIIDSTTVKLKPMLLNPGESISIFTLLTNLHEEVKVNGHIEDAPPIKEIQPPSRFSRREALFSVLGGGVGLVVIIGVGAAVGWLFFANPGAGIAYAWVAAMVVSALLVLPGLIGWLWKRFIV